MKTCVAVVWLVLLNSMWAQTPKPAPPVSAASQSVPAASPSAKIDSVKEADIRRLMELAGAKDLAAQMMAAMGRREANSGQRPSAWRISREAD